MWGCAVTRANARLRRTAAVALVAALASLQPAVVLAQGHRDLQPRGVGEGKHRYLRLDSILNGVVDVFARQLDGVESNEVAARLAAKAAAGRAAAEHAPMRRGETVAVTFRVNDPSKVEDLAHFLRSRGGDPRNVGEDYVEAYVSVGLIVEASKRPEIARVQAIVPPQPKRGPTTSQGVTVHGAPLWHALGFTGKGVKVGVIDIGFSGLPGLLGSELPATVSARCYADVGRPTSQLSACDNEGELHGTAVAEALLDVAPDASLYIADPQTNGDLASAVDWMAAQGVQVINYSVGGPWDGPGDGTSPYSDSPLNTVDAAIERGIVWASAAGNEGRSAWFGRFRDADGDGFHEFYHESEFSCFSGSGDMAEIQLRWQGEWLSDDRLADLDFYLYDHTRGYSVNPVAGGVEFQRETGIPSEGTTYQTNAGDMLCIAVYHDRTHPAPDPGWIQLVMLKSEQLSPYTVGGSIGNPAESANPGLLAVGAAPWHSTRTTEEYSSVGPTPDGRIKPDLVGVDRADSASSGGEFMGTSQAAPHIAGLAALVLDAYPTLRPREVAAYLKRNTDRRTHHDLFGGLAHPNNLWGYGLARLPPINVRYETQVANDGPQHLPLNRYFPTADASTTYSAASSNPELVAVTIRLGALVVVPAEGVEGQATITLTASFRNGLQATVTIVVAVEEAPVRPRSVAGWRLALYKAAAAKRTPSPISGAKPAP